MIIHVISLFPGMVTGPLSESMGRIAQDKGLLELKPVDLRAFCPGRHAVADDAPYGGGGGMVMKAEPVLAAIRSCKQSSPSARVVYLSPAGRRLDHASVLALSKLDSLVLLCGHYEGVDQRALDLAVDEEISIGDYVLTGGETAAVVLVDAVMRQIPGVLGDPQSAVQDSFFGGLLDFPHYTRPETVEGLKVPEVLLSGDHRKIAQWRRRQALRVTRERRPDLLEDAGLTVEDRRFLGDKEGKQR